MFDEFGNYIGEEDPGNEDGSIIVGDDPTINEPPPLPDEGDSGDQDLGVNPSTDPANFVGNSDGTQTNVATMEVYSQGEQIGWDNLDGTWVDIDGSIRDHATGEVIGVFAAEGPEYFDQPVNDSGNPQPNTGFLSGVSDFFGNLLGGSSGKNSAMQIADLARQLTQAQSSGAPAQTVSALQNQLSAARAASQGNSSTNTILFALAAAAGVYALTRRRSA